MVYAKPHGETNESQHPDPRRSLGVALARLWDERRGDGRGAGRANAEKFRSWAEREGFVLHPEAFAAWRQARRGLIPLRNAPNVTVPAGTAPRGAVVLPGWFFFRITFSIRLPMSAILQGDIALASAVGWDVSCGDSASTPELPAGAFLKGCLHQKVSAT